MSPTVKCLGLSSLYLSGNTKSHEGPAPSLLTAILLRMTGCCVVWEKMAQPLEKAALATGHEALREGHFHCMGMKVRWELRKRVWQGGSYFSVPRDVQLSHLGAPQGAAFTNTYQTLLFQQK